MSKWDAPYEPSTWEWVATQVDQYESSGGTEATTLRETGLPVVIVWMIGHKSGTLRKVPLMRVEHDGEYALVASKGGAPENPGWYYNLINDDEVRIQDGPNLGDYRVEQVEGAERDLWFQRGVEAFPTYTEYQAKTDREIPIFVARPV